MIDNELHALVLSIVDGAVTENHKEVIFRDILLDLDEDTRTEVAYLIQDRFEKQGHPVPMSRVEKYMAHRLKVAEWYVKRDSLEDELDALLADMDDAHLLEDDTSI